jgi:hypothetical protein
MIFLTPLFPPDSFVIASHRRYCIYQGKRNPVAKLTDRQFTKAKSLGLIRLGTKGRWILGRKAIRRLHGRTKLKKLYLQYCRTGKSDPVIKQQKPKPPERSRRPL